MGGTVTQLLNLQGMLFILIIAGMVAGKKKLVSAERSALPDQCRALRHPALQHCQFFCNALLDPAFAGFSHDPADCRGSSDFRGDSEQISVQPP